MKKINIFYGAALGLILGCATYKLINTRKENITNVINKEKTIINEEVSLKDRVYHLIHTVKKNEVKNLDSL